MTFTARLRRRAIWSTVATLAVVVTLGAVAWSHAADVAPAASSTTRVQRGTVSLSVAASGTVRAARTLALSFSVAGTVTDVDVNVGDSVNAGQVLARVDPVDAQAAVTSAQSRVDDARDAVDRAETSANLPACPTASAGPSTHAMTPSTATHSSTTTPTTTTSATAPVKPTPTPTATSPTATPSTGSGTARTSVGTADGQPRGFAATNVVLNEKAAPGGGSGATCAQPGRASTTDSLLTAQVQLNNALLALSQANTRLAGTTIVAPTSGRVLSVGGTVGQRAAPGGTGFVVLGDLTDLTVTAQFSEADVNALAVGQVASIGLPGRTTEVSGRVAQISPAGTVSDRLVRYDVVIAFDQVPENLLLGQSATATVTTESVDNVLYLASAAVADVRDGQGTVTVRAAGRDSVRSVTVGLRGDQYTEVRSGLAEGDEVVLPTGA